MTLQHFWHPCLLLVTFVPAILMIHHYGQSLLETNTYWDLMFRNFNIGLAVLPLLWMHSYTYSYIWLKPEKYAKFCHQKMRQSNPIKVYAGISVSMKLLQVGLMLLIALYYKGATLFISDLYQTSWKRWCVTLMLGTMGQFLNATVYYQIGIDGVYYGCKLGKEIPWNTNFPFNLGMRHPQYMGAILSWWGLFNSVMSPLLIEEGYMFLCVMTGLSYLVVAIVEEAPEPGKV